MISKKMILFDMDGTLLPMDIEKFTEGYFRLLTKKMAPYGYNGKELVSAVWAGTAAMVGNDGSRSNETVFWKTFESATGREVEKQLFDEFYENDFSGTREYCGFDPSIPELIRKIKDAGFRIALATNPIFPANAIRQRLEWAGLDPDAFELITTYENSRYCKPNPAYYADTAAKLGLAPEQCLMVGNDATEDLAAEKVGMDVFILTPGLINNDNVDFSNVPSGDADDLWKYISGDDSFNTSSDPFADMFIFRNLMPHEWAKAAELEQTCFPSNEACTPEMMKKRFSVSRDLSLVAVEKTTGKIAAMIDGLRTEERRFRDEFLTNPYLNDPKGNNVMITGVEVHPDHQGKGLATEMMNRYIELAKSFGIKLLILTCNESKIHMYEKFGFTDMGWSDSTWGGEKWHEMNRKL